MSQFLSLEFTQLLSIIFGFVVSIYVIIQLTKKGEL